MAVSLVPRLTMLDIVLCVSICLSAAWIVAKGRKRPPLPPGPKPWPILGNITDFPTTHEGRFWSKHKELYGPISSVKALGTTYIILNDADAAFELLEKRSVNYSNRYISTLSGKLIQGEKFTTFMQYGPELKKHRKLIQGYIGTVNSMIRIEAVQEVEARRFLLRILEQPQNFSQHIRTLAGAIILKISHGYTIQPEGVDALVDLAEETLDRIFFPASMHGTWAVDILPLLQYLPEWLPGMKFKRIARVWSKTVSEYYDKPFSFVRKQMAKGEAVDSFTLHHIENDRADSKRDEDALKYAGATLFAGGADTTVAVMKTFFLTMTLFPSVFRRAQEEVDRVVGKDRLPTFADRENLPYINALIKELLRWESVTPTAVPHVSVEDDVYAGYRIPKDAVVIPNTWQMSHDPALYKNPHAVMPERFLGDKSELDPYLLAFGFGRRVCPGKRLADSSLFISIVLVVATFKIGKAKNGAGQDVEPEYVYKPGLVSHPTPFQCSIIPRSEKAVELIRSVLDEHPFEKGDGDVIRNM